MRPFAVGVEMRQNRLPSTPAATIQGAQSGEGKLSLADGLKEQRSNLMSQLTSLTVRRDLLSQQLRTATGQSAIDLQASLRTLDANVKKTTSDLDRLDEAIRNAVASSTGDGSSSIGPAGIDIARIIQGAINSGTSSAAATTESRINHLQQTVSRMAAVSGVGIVLIIVALWRGLRRPRFSRDQLAAENGARLDHLQQAVDAIAVEVERISESQRFQAKIASDSRSSQGNAPPNLPR